MCLVQTISWLNNLFILYNKVKAAFGGEGSLLLYPTGSLIQKARDN